ncbi:CbtA family protein [Nitrososphaera sp.]|uniref:CbtA family protein n=1 Tax=Nitrososphaera sp. TaxID=1971748 RepID=UPI001858DDE7|nr:CbtA family protein [Nitrososphaera sp.]NWG37771.1 CbtA family protein [Nitrososphaera sp.]
MQTGRTLALSMASGMAAAAVLVAMNYLVAGPYVSELEFQYIDIKLAEGFYIEEDIDQALQAQHFWRAGFPVIMGISGGALVALAYARRGKGAFMVALSVAAVSWFSLYVMPALKYPLVPDVLFDPAAAGQYAVLFAGYSAASGLAALGTAIGFAKTGRKNWYFGAAGAYLAIVAGLYAVFPSLPEPEFYDMALLGQWRSATAAGMTAFWFTLGILAGALLEREEKKGAGRGI